MLPITKETLNKKFPFVINAIENFCIIWNPTLLYYKDLKKSRLKIFVINLGTFYFRKGKFHRSQDKPAIILNDGSKYYWKYGKRHRKTGPAVIKHNGTQFWYQYGIRHRDVGPAVEYVSGTREYWFKGKLHRTDGPAIVYDYENILGEKYVKEGWYYHGLSHRNFGPSYTRLNYEDDVLVLKVIKYTLKDKLHNLQGPAVIHNKFERFYINDTEYTKTYHRKVVGKTITFLNKLKQRHRNNIFKILNNTFCSDLSKSILQFII